MKQWKKAVALGLSVAAVVSLAACSSSSSTTGTTATEAAEATTDATQASEAESTASGERQKLTVGIIARDEEIIEWLADKLSDKYEIVPQIYSETVSVMQAAADGENDLNYIANIPYLEAYNENYGSDLIFYQDQIVTSPVLVVSQKYTSVDEIPDNALGAVANDNSNRKRELEILENAGLIELDNSVDYPSVLDITSNPKNLDIKEIDARSRVGALPDLDFMTMPAMTYAMMDQATIDSCNILTSETDQEAIDTSGQGFCILKENEDAQWIKDIYELACSKEFADFINETYPNVRIPSGYYLHTGEITYQDPQFNVPDIY